MCKDVGNADYAYLLHFKDVAKEFKTLKKTVEVAAPVAIEGAKAALPAAIGGIQAVSRAIDTGSVAVDPTPLDIDA